MHTTRHRYGCDLHALQACTTRCETKDDPKGGAKGGAKHAWQVKCKDGSVHPADAVVGNDDDDADGWG